MSLKKNLLANYLGQGWTALMGIVFVPVYIHYLGMESYGLIGLFAMLLAFLALLDMGLTPTLNREMARFKAGAHSVESIHDLLRSLEIICAVIAVSLASIMWACSGWLAGNWLQAKDLSVSAVGQAVAIMGFVAALRLAEGLYRGAIIGLQRQVWLNGVLAFFATVRGVGAVVVLAFFSPTINAYFLWQGMISVLIVIVLAVGVHGWLPETKKMPVFSWQALAGIRRFAGGMMATTILALLLTQMDKILLSRLLSLEVFGVYALATTVASALYQLVIPVTQAYYPRFTELVTLGQEKELAAAYHQGAQLISVLVGSAALCLVFFGETVLQVWTGDTALTQEVMPILRLLALGTLFNSLMNIPYMLQLSYGWSGFAAKINSVAVIILVPAILWVVPRYGSVGAAWVWLVLNAGYIFFAVHLMHRRLLPNEKWNWYVVDTFLPLLVSATTFSMFYLFHLADRSIYFQLFWIMMSATCAVAASTMASSRLREQVFYYFRSWYANNARA